MSTKKIQKLQKSEKMLKNLKKSLFFKKLEKLRWYFFSAEKKKKNAFLLVLPIEEISLRPELSSPAHFRNQGGSPERDGGGGGGEGQKKSSCLIQDTELSFQTDLPDRRTFVFDSYMGNNYIRY